ncbi:MAG: HAD family hydrolase [Thermoleophilaceae bacterium]|nr:HAD family hydrolase [Thermoleophilaceae bacterium]
MRAVLLDSFGTLLRMDEPGPHLRAELATRGIEVGEEEAAAAFRAEIRYYLAHNLEGRDPSSLADLRDRCARVVRESLGLGRERQDDVREAMLAAIRFRPYEDARPALAALRERGVRTVVASNWDCSLPEALERVGLRPLVDGVVASAVVGAAKPAAALFHAALELAGCEPGEALHVGDSLDKDVQGARAAGLRAVLLARDGTPSGAGSLEAISTLSELPGLVT